MVGEVVEQVREAIARQMQAGATLDEVDELVIGPAPGLSEDERAALWLYAWSSPRRGRGATGAGLGADDERV
jgi:hypothetical protein